MRRALGALSVVGGGIDRLRVGSRVECAGGEGIVLHVHPTPSSEAHAAWANGAPERTAETRVRVDMGRISTPRPPTSGPSSKERRGLTHQFSYLAAPQPVFGTHTGLNFRIWRE